MEFISGQKLTAQNLNSLVSLAEGQNIPTDQQFIKSKGVNTWTPFVSRPEKVKNHKIFDVQVRYHDVNDKGQEKGEDYEADYKPFWYVYLGSDRVGSGDLTRWDIKIEAGSGTQLMQPIWVFTQPLPKTGSLDDFEYKDAITEMTRYRKPESETSPDTYKQFYGGKFLDNEPQLINSDLNGWYCTGLPAFNFEKDDVYYNFSDLYATFVRTNDTLAGVAGNVYFTALVFSNEPIMGLASIKRENGYNVELPDGDTVQYVEIMGEHSQKIGSYKMTAAIDPGYGVENTSLIPRDIIRKQDDNWEIVTPTVPPDDDDESAAKQLHTYQFSNCSYIAPDGTIMPFMGNLDPDDDEAPPNKNIYFDKILANNSDKPDAYAVAYYVELVYDASADDDEDQGEGNPHFEIHKIPNASGSLTFLRSIIQDLEPLADIEIYNKNQESTAKRHVLLSMFILNTNEKINPNPEQEPITWSIEYISYCNRMPDFRGVESDDIRFKLRAREEKRHNDEDDKIESKFHIEYYNGFFLKSDNTEDTGVRWNTRQFQNIMPNLALGWHELTSTEWGEDPSDYTVYLNLTATYQSTHDVQQDFHGQYEVSINPKAENRVVDKGTNSISATYVVGQLKYRDGYKVTQNVIGEQNFLEMFDDTAISAAAGDILSNMLSDFVPPPDAQVPLVGLSSINIAEGINPETEEPINVYEIFEFHDIHNQVQLTENRNRHSDILIRTRDTDGEKPAIVEYLPLSTVLDQISGTCSCEISGDSQISTLQLSSVVFDTITHTITDEQGMEKVVSAQAISLFNFNDPNGLTNKTNPWQLSAHDFVLRKHDGSNMYLEYWSLSNVLSTESISTDNQLPFGLSSLQTKHYDQGKYHQIFGFEDLTNGRDASEVPEAQVLVRNSDGYNADIQYVNLSSLSGNGGKIRVDTDIDNQTSSLQLLSTSTGEWYQLYNFDKSSVDLTVASDLNGPGRWYAPAPTGLTDTSALFLVKDTQSKQLKYAQLSVTPPAVDNCSIQRFWSPDFPGQPQMLSLNRFWQHPLDGTITGVLSSNNQVVTFSEPGGTGTFLMQNYLNGRLNLKYMKLQLSVDLSAVSADVKCDTDSTAAQKSIEKNAGYIQLHDFPNPTITTKKTTLDNLSATYDLLDTNDAVLVRSGTELKYKKLQIETKLPGGGQTEGLTIDLSVVVSSTYSEGNHTFINKMKKLSFENGLLTATTDLADQLVFTAVEHIAHD